MSIEQGAVQSPFSRLVQKHRLRKLRATADVEPRASALSTTYGASNARKARVRIAVGHSTVPAEAPPTTVIIRRVVFLDRLLTIALVILNAVLIVRTLVPYACAACITCNMRAQAGGVYCIGFGGWLLSTQRPTARVADLNIWVGSGAMLAVAAGSFAVPAALIGCGATAKHLKCLVLLVRQL